MKVFKTGNEMIAEAAKAIDFHFMGYFPITPSTEIAQIIDRMKTNGELRTVLLPADGEHGAAGACFGASTGGARVLNATSANGFLYSLEQLPVQAGCRQPMVLNLVTRSVSGPLNIRCDHSDLQFALLSGWIILLASTPQAAYDMNLIAVKIGEKSNVRLPVMVVTDGFFTSHQRQQAEIFPDRTAVQKFLGLRQDSYTTLEPRHPVTIGPYMNDPDLINNKFQLHEAHAAAAEGWLQITEEFKQLTGRDYPAIELYQMHDAEVALWILNSAAETAKDAVDQMRAKGIRAGLLRPNILRPFPSEILLAATKNLNTLVICDRADLPGSKGTVLAHEVVASLRGNPQIKILHRIFGIGGKEFSVEDAVAILEDSRTESAKEFSFFGASKGDPAQIPSAALPPLDPAALRAPLVAIQERDNHIDAFPLSVGELTRRPKRIAAGHSACPGCGIFSGLDQFFKGISGDVVVLYHTGCAMVVTTDYPFSAHRVTYLHNLFQNGAPTLAGLVEAFHEKRRRGEISTKEEITFVMITGDGGMDIGLGPTLGTAIRNHPMIVLEYDNQGYMNTGGQLSYATPMGHATSTSHVGKHGQGKSFAHRDTPQLMAATGIPYVFTAVESLTTDLVAKAAKAQWYANHHGFAFGKILVPCPISWQSEEKRGTEILERAVDSCFFPLYEVERGKTKLSYNPETVKAKQPISHWLECMGKTKHLLLPENQALYQQIQIETDLRWNRLKAKHEHPLL